MTVSRKELLKETERLRSRLEELERNQAERKKVEEALKAEKEFLETALNAQTDTFFVFEPSTGRAVRWNQAFSNVSGYSDEEIRSMKAPDSYYNEEDLKKATAASKEVLGEGIATVELSLITKDGREIPTEYTGSAISDNEGNPRYIIAIGRDITERKQVEEAIWASESEKKSILNAISDQLLFHDADLAIRWGNEAAAISMGMTQRELIGCYCYELWHGRSEPCERCPVLRAIETRSHTEDIMTTPEGKWWEVIAEPVCDRDGQVKGAIEIARDITERKKAENALQESEQRLKILFESAPDAIYLNDLKGNIVDGNRAAEEMTGYKREELIGENLAESGLLLPEQVPEVIARLEKNALGEPIGPEEFTLKRKDGSYVTVEVRTFPVRIRNQTLSLGIARDVSARKKVEEALRESENSYRAVVENAAEGIVVVQGQRLQFVNPSLVSMIGYSEEELLTRPFIEFIHPDHREWAMGIHIKRLKGEQVPPIYEFKVLDKKGNTKWLENNGILIEWHNEPATLNFLRDVTGRKKAEEILKYRMEFERLITMLSKRFIDPGDIDQKIREALKSIGEFASVDRAYVFQLRQDGRTADNTHEWCADGVQPQIEGLKGIVLDDALPWFWEKVRAHQTFHVPVVADLPPEAHLEKAHFEAQDIQAMVVVPMLSEGALRGFLGFDSVRSQKTWAEDIIVLLRITGENISLALDRQRAEQALLESEGKFRNLAEQSPNMVFIYRKGRVVYANERCEKIMGYKKEEICSADFDFMVLIAPQSRDLVKKSFSEHMKGNEVAPFEYTLLTKQGERIEAIYSPKLIKYEGENAILGTVTDITELKRAQDALRDREETIRALVETSRDWIWSIDVHGVHTYCNPAVEEILGYSADELIGKRGLDLMHEDDRKMVEAKLSSWVAEKRGWNNLLIRWRHKDGGYRYLESSAVPILSSEDKLIGFRGVDRDITQRKQAEEALRESEEKHRSMIELAPDAIIVVNRLGLIVSCNGAAEKISGYSKDELVGGHFTKLGVVRPEDIPKYLSMFAKGLKGHVQEPFEADFVRKDGRNGIVEVRVSLLEDGHIQVIATDITDRKQAEQKFLEDQAQLKSLASQLSLTEERERHHIATELHDRIGQSLVISKIKLDELRESAASRELTEALHEVCNCLGQVIQDTRMLTFDLSFPILYELGFEAAVAEWLAEQIREKHGIETEFEDDGKPKPLDDDIRVILFRNVRELLINVVKHANAQNVRVSIRKVGERICVTVEDDGVGFDPAEAASMAAERATFGLFSIRERLEQLEGYLEIESGSGRGSRITMTAPLKHEEMIDGAPV